MLKKTALLLAIVCLSIYNSVGTASDLGYKPGELIVRFAPKSNGKYRTSAEGNELLASLDGGTVKHSYKFVPGLVVVKLPQGKTVKDALAAFKNASGILYAEPDYEIKLLSMFPNDTRFNELWARPEGRPGSDPRPRTHPRRRPRCRWPCSACAAGRRCG